MKLDGRIPDLFCLSSMSLHTAEARKLLQRVRMIPPEQRPLAGPLSGNTATPIVHTFINSVPFVQLPLAPASTSPWIELVLVEGTIIRVPQQNLTALQTVLHALSSVPRSPSLGEARHA